MILAFLLRFRHAFSTLFPDIQISYTKAKTVNQLEI